MAAIVLSSILIEAGKKIALEQGKKILYHFKDSALGSKNGSLICYRKKENYKNVILFVHGFSGSAAETFGCIPDMLESEEQFAGWDIFSIGYSTDIFPSIGKGLWSVNPDIAKVGLNLATLLRNQFDDYNRICFVAHSMGGLAVQSCIVNLLEDERKKLSHVLFFGTPSAGLRKAAWFNFWNRQIGDLSDESDFIINLRKQWATIFPNEISFTFKTIAGSKDEFVPVISSLKPFDEKYHGVIEGNHVNMIKPNGVNDKQNEAYGIILKTLTDQKIQYLKGDPEEINLLMGEYHAIINKYLPAAKGLAVTDLRKLVFALECSGRDKEALDVLMQHESAGEITDIMGVIGGRFKRLYLQSGLKQHLDSAVKFYSDALARSVPENNKGQIFYHAINLAFLELVGFDNKNKMKEYATLALVNCDTNSNDYWEIATLAEAAMYLGDIVTATKYCKDAVKLPGAIVRNKVSTHTNIYNGYVALMSGGNINDPFLLMLDDLFLQQ